MRKTLGVCLLTLILTGSAAAGEIQNGSPAPPTNTTQAPTTDGDIQNDAADSLTQTVLDLLAALPSLF
jgi:hypothetical protein